MNSREVGRLEEGKTEMPGKAPATISGVLTLGLFIVGAILSVFVQMLALNGARERQGATAMGISQACLGIGTIHAVILAAWLTKFTTAKFSWNNIPAVITAVIAGPLFGSAISLLSTFISILLAETK